MKKCKKCGAIFEDDFEFCSKCGEKLEKAGTCPRCGSTVSPDDAFCGHCGFDLKNGNKCRSCGAEIKEGSRFCPKCGKPLDSHQIIEKKSTNKVAGKTNTIINVVLCSVFLFVSLLMIIGFFGAIAKVSYIGTEGYYSESLTIKYFFGDGADSLKLLRWNYGHDSEYYLYKVVFFVIYNIFYFGGLLSLLVAVSFGVYKVIKSLTAKEEFKRKYFLYLVYSALPYIILTAYSMLMNVNTNIVVSFGWGIILLIIATIFSALAFSFSFISDAVIQKGDYAGRIALSGSIILTIIAAIIGFSKQASISQSGVSIGLSSYNLGELLLISSFSGGYYPNIETIVSCLGISIVLTLFAMIFVPLVILFASLERRWARIVALVFGGTLFVFTLTSCIFSATCVGQLYATAKNVTSGIGGGGIASIILSAFSTALLVVALVIKRPQKR